MKARHLLGPIGTLLLLLILPRFTVRSPWATESILDSPLPAIPTVTLRVASGATIPFMTQNGKVVHGNPPRTRELPYLVLYRNGVLSNAHERTLVVEITGIDVLPGGVTVTLLVETEHPDPDAGTTGPRIPVWQASRSIESTLGVTQTNVTVTFEHEFTSTIVSGGASVATPTDYFRYEVTVMDTSNTRALPLYTFSQGHALLVENQWIARLPGVAESATGAAPDELVVYYCDMFPFLKSHNEPATRLPRKAITGCVGKELVPRFVEAFWVLTDEWGFPWYEEWTSYQAASPERLSVALTDGQTWFHGTATRGGHSGISIGVAGGANVPFATLSDGLVSTFTHELFHNVQRNINLHHGGDGNVGGAEDAWRFFSEGTAVWAEWVGQPQRPFTQTLTAHTFMSLVNVFVEQEGKRDDSQNSGLDRLGPHQSAIYWGFLFEQCRDVDAHPAAGTEVIRRALDVLYSGEVVDIRSSTDLVGMTPAVMDRALAGSSCPFQTYSESVTAFTRALYDLPLDSGAYDETWGLDAP